MVLTGLLGGVKPANKLGFGQLWQAKGTAKPNVGKNLSLNVRLSLNEAQY